MKLVPEIDFYINSFSNNPFVNRDLINILFNKKNEFIVNKQILSHIEKEIDSTNLEYFQAFVKEIFDDSRYVSETTLTIDNYKNDVFHFYNNSNDSYLIPIKAIQDSEFKRDEFENLLDLTDISNNNYNYILLGLLCTNLICFDFSKFNSNDDIDELFKNLFKIPKKINQIYCFNRDYCSRFLVYLANEKIFYYSLVNRDFPRNIHEYKEMKKEMKKDLGDKLRVYTTKKRSLIHERKIFIEGLSITFDNAFENILIEEPTWEIVIEYCEKKYSKWIEKKSQFIELN